LRVRPDTIRHVGREQAKSGSQHAHKDWAQSEHNSGDSGVFNRVALHAKLFDVLEHVNPSLYGDAKKSKEPHT
jgi:hypothetical protein